MSDSKTDEETYLRSTDKTVPVHQRVSVNGKGQLEMKYACATGSWTSADGTEVSFSGDPTVNGNIEVSVRDPRMPKHRMGPGVHKDTVYVVKLRDMLDAVREHHEARVANEAAKKEDV